MICTTRKEALLNNEKQYFTGNSCPKGHVAFRKTKNGECVACSKLTLIKWREKNPHKVKEHNAKQYLKYETEKFKWQAIRKRYANKHRANLNAKAIAYQLNKKKRIPKWADKNHMLLIKEVYELAALRTKQFGFSWHVDHIIPLNGKLVSGLHVIENLQVIPGIENIKKTNRFTIE